MSPIKKPAAPVENTTQALGWTMAYREGTSNKFYEVILTESNWVVLRWGRIGSQGQSSATRYGSYSEGHDVALRQVYAKKSKGYVSSVSEYPFPVTNEAIKQAAGGVAYALASEFVRAQREGQFAGSKAIVLKHYEDFSNRAQHLLAQAGELSFDDAMSEFEDLEKTFAEITSKHEEVSTSMGLVRATLMQKLMAGSLGGSSGF